jgi:putative protease
MTELLAPAGTSEALDAAVAEGADAVYLGLKNFNARLRSQNFTRKEAENATRQLHRRGKKIYITVNTLCEERELDELYNFLLYLDGIGPDGIIVQDFGVIKMAQDFFPRLKLHASTQMNTACARAVNTLGKAGVKRVVLARETTLDEIRSIKTKTGAEIEVFVHGALCVSESGLCLFSSYLGGKSANRGMCTQACRRLYTVEDEESRGRTGYFFSPNDLELIDKIPELVAAGVDAFKIEGRMKSAEYVGAVTAAYRYMLDNAIEGASGGNPADAKGALAAAKRILAGDFGRAKTRFWYGFACDAGNAANTAAVAEETLNPDQAGGTGIYLGKIAKTKRPGMPGYDYSWSGNARIFATITGGNYEPDEGDSIRLHKKDDSRRESHKIKEVFVKSGTRWIDIPEGFSQGDGIYLLQTKSMSKRYPKIIPSNARGSPRQKPKEKPPAPDLKPLTKSGAHSFPKGLYIKVSTFKDLFVVQSEHPVRVILELNSESKAEIQKIISAQTPLPFSKKQIFLELEPFCPESEEPEISALVEILVENGFANWIANNAAHISMLRNKDVTIVAGQYLYAFNRWAAAWLEKQRVVAFVSPLENSRKNLEEVFDRRERVLVPVFAYPALFRMRFKLPESYDFTYFSDKKNAVFKTLETRDGSFVLPQEPFSIADLTAQLQSAGFSRFLIDLSKIAVHKKHLKQIVGAMQKSAPLFGTTRFNWNDGFFAERVFSPPLEKK